MLDLTSPAMFDKIYGCWMGKNCGGNGCGPGGFCGPLSGGCPGTQTCINGVCTCSTPVPCQWGAWSTCSGSVPQSCSGTRTRSKVVTESFGGSCSCNGPLCPGTDTDPTPCVRDGYSWNRPVYKQWNAWVTEVYTCRADSSTCPCPINALGCGKGGLINQNCAFKGYNSVYKYCQDNQCACDPNRTVSAPNQMCNCNDYFWDNGSSCQACSYTGTSYTCGPMQCGTNNKVCPTNYHCWPCDQDGRGGCAFDVIRCP